MGMGNNPNLSRQSRRLYIGSITPEVNETNLADFFNNKMKEMNIGTSAAGNPVLAVQCNYEKNYAFVEVIISLHMIVITSLLTFYSFEVPKTLRPPWLLMESYSLMDRSRFVDQKIMVESIFRRRQIGRAHV